MPENIGRRFKFIGDDDSNLLDCVIEIHSQGKAYSYIAMIVENPHDRSLGHRCGGAFPRLQDRGFYVTLGTLPGDFWDVYSERNWEEVGIDYKWEV